MFVQFVVGKNLFEVVINGVRLHVVELRHHFLAQPDVFVRIDCLDATFAFRGDEGEVFCRRGARDGDFFVGLLFLWRHNVFVDSAYASSFRCLLWAVRSACR